MKTAAKYVAALVVAILCLMPPVAIKIEATINSTPWLWCILMSGLLGFLFLYTKANPFIKFLVIFCFINSFLSSTPYMSFTLYISVVAAAYFYLLCRQIRDWSVILKVVQGLFFVTMPLIVLQAFGKDTLLNFNSAPEIFFGTINNPMMLASFIACLTPFLIIGNPLNIAPILIIAYMSQSAGLIFTLAVALVFYLFFRIRNKLLYFLTILILTGSVFAFVYKDTAVQCFKEGGRGPVWRRTIELANEKPWTGWGIGTFKVVFPTLSKDVAGGITDKWVYEWTEGDWIAWRKTHNCWYQFIFELGWIGFAGMLGLVGFFIWRFIRVKKTHIVIMAGTGLMLYMANMTVHFPTRMIQTLVLMLCYVAYYEHVTSQEDRKIYG